MKDIRLSPRIQMVADMVPKQAVLCDVGTDYAYLPAWLVQNGRCPHAVASDLREGPLSRAADTVEKTGLHDKISLRLAPGLSAVQPKECTAVSICGMGGETIAAILKDASWLEAGEHTLLLQPQSKAELLRQFLWEHGYKIEKERLCTEEHRIYTAMLVIGNRQEREHAPLWRCYFSQPLLQETLAGVYLDRLVKREQDALDGLKLCKNPDMKLLEQKRKTVQYLLESKRGISI